ncbi:MAG: hypothetical protein MUE85_23895 [Microscillaceae bacterium]|jgi:hypothetical protein|nr:hypothetical protein [Microscillaceae bacterium]
MNQKTKDFLSRMQSLKERMIKAVEGAKEMSKDAEDLSKRFEAFFESVKKEKPKDA